MLRCAACARGEMRQARDSARQWSLARQSLCWNVPRGWPPGPARSSCRTRQWPRDRGLPAPWRQPPVVAHLRTQLAVRQDAHYLCLSLHACVALSSTLVYLGSLRLAFQTRYLVRALLSALCERTCLAVVCDGSSQPHAGGATSCGADCQGRDVDHCPQHLGLGHSWVSHLRSHVGVTARRSLLAHGARAV